VADPDVEDRTLMSATEPRPPTPPPSTSSGCLTALLILIGIVMLLPGLCAFIIIGADPNAVFNDPTAMAAFLGFLAIGAGGITLIVVSIRRARRS
jgi:hypothetical protein